MATAEEILLGPASGPSAAPRRVTAEEILLGPQPSAGDVPLAPAPMPASQKYLARIQGFQQAAAPVVAAQPDGMPPGRDQRIQEAQGRDPEFQYTTGAQAESQKPAGFWGRNVMVPLETGFRQAQVPIQMATGTPESIAGANIALQQAQAPNAATAKKFAGQGFMEGIRNSPAEALQHYLIQNPIQSLGSQVAFGSQTGTGLLAAIPRVGVPLATAASSGGLEYSGELMSLLQERGIDTNNPRSLKMAFESPALMAEVRWAAGTKALVVGLSDAATAKISGAIAGPLKSATVRKGVTALGAEVAGGGWGELASQVAQGAVEGDVTKRYDPAAIAAELGGKLGPGSLTVMEDIANASAKRRARPATTTTAQDVTPIAQTGKKGRRNRFDAAYGEPEPVIGAPGSKAVGQPQKIAAPTQRAMRTAEGIAPYGELPPVEATGPQTGIDPYGTGDPIEELARELQDKIRLSGEPLADEVSPETVQENIIRAAEQEGQRRAERVSPTRSLEDVAEFQPERGFVDLEDPTRFSGELKNAPAAAPPVETLPPSTPVRADAFRERVEPSLASEDVLFEQQMAGMTDEQIEAAANRSIQTPDDFIPIAPTRQPVPQQAMVRPEPARPLPSRLGEETAPQLMDDAPEGYPSQGDIIPSNFQPNGGTVPLPRSSKAVAGEPAESSRFDPFNPPTPNIVPNTPPPPVAKTRRPKQAKVSEPQPAPPPQPEPKAKPAPKREGKAPKTRLPGRRRGQRGAVMIPSGSDMAQATNAVLGIAAKPVGKALKLAGGLLNIPGLIRSELDSAGGKGEAADILREAMHEAVAQGQTYKDQLEPRMNRLMKGISTVGRLGKFRKLALRQMPTAAGNLDTVGRAFMEGRLATTGDAQLDSILRGLQATQKWFGDMMESVVPGFHGFRDGKGMVRFAVQSGRDHYKYLADNSAELKHFARQIAAETGNPDAAAIERMFSEDKDELMAEGFKSSIKKSGPLEFHRSIKNLPPYVTDLRGNKIQLYETDMGRYMLQYLHSLSNRAGFIKVLGSDEKKIRRALETVGTQEGPKVQESFRKLIEKYHGVAVNQETNSSFQEARSLYGDFVETPLASMMLTNAWIPNLFQQGVWTIPTAGRDYLRGLYHLATKPGMMREVHAMARNMHMNFSRDTSAKNQLMKMLAHLGEAATTTGRGIITPMRIADYMNAVGQRAQAESFQERIRAGETYTGDHDRLKLYEFTENQIAGILEDRDENLIRLIPARAVRNIQFNELHPLERSSFQNAEHPFLVPFRMFSGYAVSNLRLLSRAMKTYGEALDHGTITQRVEATRRVMQIATGATIVGGLQIALRAFITGQSMDRKDEPWSEYLLKNLGQGLLTVPFQGFFYTDEDAPLPERIATTAPVINALWEISEMFTSTGRYADKTTPEKVLTFFKSKTPATRMQKGYLVLTGMRDEEIDRAVGEYWDAMGGSKYETSGYDNFRAETKRAVDALKNGDDRAAQQHAEKAVGFSFEKEDVDTDFEARKYFNASIKRKQLVANLKPEDWDALNATLETKYGRSRTMKIMTALEQHDAMLEELKQ